MDAIHVFPVRLDGRWSASTHRFEEALSILEPSSWNTGSAYESVQGSTESRFTCTADPVIGPASCSGVAHQNQSTVATLSDAFESGRPLAAGLASLQQATALSASTGGGSVPPPPPPAPKPTIALKSGSGIPRVVLKAPVAGTAFAAGSLHLEAVVPAEDAQAHRLTGLRFEWQSRGGPVRRGADPDVWTDAAVLPHAAWTGTDGAYLVVRADVPAERLRAAPRWRVRSVAGGGTIQPSDWVEFSVRAPRGR